MCGRSNVFDDGSGPVVSDKEVPNRYTKCVPPYLDNVDFVIKRRMAPHRSFECVINPRMASHRTMLPEKSLLKRERYKVYRIFHKCVIKRERYVNDVLKKE